MSDSRRKVFNVIRLLIIIWGLVGIAVIVLHQFDNRNIKMVFFTDEGKRSLFLSNDIIAEGEFGTILFENTDEVKLKKINFYGNWESVLLKGLEYSGIASHISNVDQGTVYWEDDGIIITGTGNVCFDMDADFIEIVQELSATFLQERLVMVGTLIAIVMLSIILCNGIQEKCTKENWNNHGPVYEIKKFMSDMRHYWQYMVFSARADLKAEVADSYLNRLWWLLEPFFNMVVYVIVFGQVMGNSVENYATFVFSALLMWNFFNKIIAYSVKLVRSNKDIVTKVYIPKFVILFSNMILNFLKLLFSMIVLVIMLVIFRVDIGINFVWIFPAYLVMTLLAFGAGMIFLHFGVYVDDLSYAVGILLNMLMFLSGIFYDVMATLPEPLNGLMICLNPVAMFVDTMRQALLYNTMANLPILGMWFLISIILCYMGVHIVYKNENSYVKVV